MKVLPIYMLSLILLISCQTTTSSTEGNDSTQQSQKQETNTVKKISENEFKISIFDFELSPTNWKFKDTRPCIVDCYADWCRPCKKIAPYFDTLANEYAGKINFYKINIDEAQNLSVFFQINSIPTVMFCNDEMMQYAAGAYPIEFYRHLIDSLLLNK